MKFAHQLLYNSVPEWASGYINYDLLKAEIYNIEKQKVRTGTYAAQHDVESQGLLSDHGDSSDAEFIHLLDKELDKISNFFKSKYNEVKRDLESVVNEVDEIENAIDDDDDARSARSDLLSVLSDEDEEPQHPHPHSHSQKQQHQHQPLRKQQSLESAGESSDNPPSALVVDKASEGGTSSSKAPVRPRSVSQPRASRERALSRGGAVGVGDHRRLSLAPSDSHLTAESSAAASNRRISESLFGTIPDSVLRDFRLDIRVTYKLRLQYLYRELSQLKQFTTLNYTGFRKIIKKYDKVNDSSLLTPYMTKTIDLTYPFRPQDSQSLSNDVDQVITLYAHVVTEGNTERATEQLRTILREHIVWERNTVWREMIGLTSKGWSSKPTGGSRTVVDRPVVVSDSPEPKTTRVLGGRFKIPTWLLHRQFLGFAFGFLVFLLLLAISPFDTPEESNCLAILALCTIFWSLEVIPLFATSILVPFLVVFLRVIRDPEDGSRLNPQGAATFIFKHMFTPTIMLLIGGFTLAAGLSKHSIDRILSSRVLHLAGTRPTTVLFAYMAVACFASMWISNVAAPVLCFGLIQPILRTLPSRSNFAKALILGIALSANIGGLSSPISSPQNLIALEYMHPQVTWLSWFAVAIPIAIIVLVALWSFLIWAYKWDKDTIINPTKRPKEKFTRTQWLVSLISIFTIILWCIEHKIEPYIGDMGIIALIPMVLFFTFGILRKADWESYPWSIVMLAMGGIALGKAVESSGLLEDVDILLRNWVKGLPLWPLVVVISLCTVVVATFISHTIAAVLIVPIAAQVGDALDDPHPRLLIMTVAFVSSTAMGLPVSSFPNQAAVSLEDDLGIPYLSASDFLKTGIPMSVTAVGIVMTAGYLLMRLIGI